MVLDVINLILAQSNARFIGPSAVGIIIGPSTPQILLEYHRTKRLRRKNAIGFKKIIQIPV